ncbi:MAG: exosortase [Leptolyngbya sp. PLA3]|nr:MAG: exosortase [Cyanobacteria bacterium CYA]MCE7969512.1 exosortase [Leptolyngbya sp. PL-A3]
MSGVQGKSVGIGSAVEADAPARCGLFSTTGLVITGLLTAAFVGLFFRWFYTQGRFSAKFIEDWGHSFVIPGISIYLLWRHREALAKVKGSVFWPGLAPFLLGIATYFAGIVTIRNHMVQGFAMILTLFGLVLLMLGPKVMRYAFMPIAFLVFGVTLSQMVMEKVTFQLKLIASKGSYIMLDVLGPVFDYTVELTGNTLHIFPKNGAEIPLNVADACSGMRMVIAFFALAGAVALLTTNRWWQRIALMLLAGPVAVAMNVVRVAVLGLVSLVDPDLASGDAHMVIGTILLVPSLLFFLGLGWVLERLISEPAGVKA